MSKAFGSIKQGPISRGNLVERAGRPGTARGIEGMTLIALPTHISTTAKGQRATQVQQKAQLAND